MGRTNIEIDEELIRRIMKRYGLRTKREAVEYALQRLDRVGMTREADVGDAREPAGTAIWMRSAAGTCVDQS